MLYELRIKIPASREDEVGSIRTAMIGHGLQSHAIVETHVRGHIILSMYFFRQRQAQRSLRQCQNILDKRQRISLKRLHDHDWQRRWKDDFKPFPLTRRIHIVPLAWKRQFHLRERIPIYMDSGLSFGTGLHETTRMMANLIDERKGQFDSFLDVGTGTGILSMVAVLSGAKDVHAVDRDSVSVRTARENFSLNGMRPTGIVSGDFTTLPIETRFDFIAANLLTRDLISLGRKFCHCLKTGGYLAVSGISRKNLPIFRKNFQLLPFKLLRIFKGKDWVALLYTKTSASLDRRRSHDSS